MRGASTRHHRSQRAKVAVAVRAFRGGPCAAPVLCRVRRGGRSSAGWPACRRLVAAGQPLPEASCRKAGGAAAFNQDRLQPDTRQPGCLQSEGDACAEACHPPRFPVGTGSRSGVSGQRLRPRCQAPSASALPLSVAGPAAEEASVAGSGPGESALPPAQGRILPLRQGRGRLKPAGGAWRGPKGGLPDSAKMSSETGRGSPPPREKSDKSLEYKAYSASFPLLARFVEKR